MNILYVTARFPFPPHKGDQAVPYYRLKHLGNRHDITLLTFYQTEQELEHLPQIAPFCKKIVTVKKSRFASLLSMVGCGLFSKIPLQVLYYRSRRFETALQQLLAQQKFDLIHVYMLRIAHIGANLSQPCVLELIDSMQLNFQRRAAREKMPLKLLFNLELARLNHYEPEMITYYQRAIVVSDTDRDHIGLPVVETIQLGVDTDTFRPAAPVTEPVLTFTGNLGYFPNRNAVHWFLENSWPAIKAAVPHARLIIAGKDPGAALLRYHDGLSVEVTGYVPSMAAIIQASRLAIAPMQAGSGMQFKILEAMACAVPVVSTSLGLGTIPAEAEESILIADNAADFSRQCIRLLNDVHTARRIGDNGYALINKNFGWQINARHMEAIYRRLTPTAS